jgi:hypothetical protein
MKPLSRMIRRVRVWLGGAPGWVGGMLAGFQAALFSLAVILLPLWAAVASAPAGAGAGPDWGGASRSAAHLWLLGFGVPWDIDGVTVSVPPLGVTVLAALMLVALARRFADKTWTSWLLTVASFTAVVVVVATLAWAGAEDTTRRAFGAGVVAVLVAAPSAAVGIWRAHGATLAWLSALPHSVRAGLRMGAAAAGVHVTLAAAVGAAWTVSGRHSIAEVATSLGPDAVGGVVLAALETLFTPTLVIWYMSWDVGLGFSVGLAHFAPSELVAAPLPQIPLLGALPTAAGGALSWVPFLVVVVVAAVRLALRSRMPRGIHRLGAGAIAVACVAVLAGVLGWFSSGALGPGSLAQAGVHWPTFAVMTAAITAAGLVLAELVEAVLRLIGIGIVATSRPAAAARTSGRPSAPPASSSRHVTSDDEEWLS